MLTRTANGDSRLSFWLRVREFAVPPSMIETATARRSAGDWAGACAAAGIDVDFNLRSVARTHGHDLAARIRADLRHLAPDLLRWHLPRVAPDGLLRPGLTIALARYEYVAAGREGAHPVYLVVRTPPAWADAGQRISLALWGGPGFESGSYRHPHPHPHPHPNRRYRLDLHRHLWDARRADELRVRSGADRPRAPSADPDPDPDPLGMVPQERRCAVDRWAAEAGILLHAEGRTDGTGTVAVRIGARHRLALKLTADRDGLAPPVMRIAAAPTDGSASALPVLPDAATWVLPDLELIRTGSLEVDRLHPLVASALMTGRSPTRSSPFRTGPRANRDSWSAVGPSTGSAWSTGYWRRWTTTPPRSAGRNCWSRSPALRSPVCRPSTRHTGVRTVSPASANAWSTATPPARWPSSKACSAPTRCCAAAPCGTSWRRPRHGGSRTGCSGRA